MSTISILPDSASQEPLSFRAIAGTTESSGKTAGEALDAINDKLARNDAFTLVILHHDRPDHFFSAQQRDRLAELMQRWRQSRDSASALPADEQAELNQLVEAETAAAAERAAALIRGLSR
jgi:hypothetical protein